MPSIKEGIVGWAWFNPLNVDWAILLHSLGRRRVIVGWSGSLLVEELPKG